MTEKQDEEDQLRSVTLQNARSIFLARQRAEEDLVRAKDALSKQTEWFRVTLASIGDAVVTTDTEARVLSMNTVAEGLVGWTEEEARGRPLSEVFRIVNEQTRESVENPAERALREGCIVGLANHTVVIARDGTETAIDDSAAPIRDDQDRVQGVVLVFRSIEQKKRAEDALSEAQARLAAIVESSQDAIVSKTLEGRIVSWNAGAEQLFGYSQEEVRGRPITIIIPPERQDEERTILERLRCGERIAHYETVRVTKHGRRIHVSLTISPVRDAAGRIVGASKIARDISDKKRAEQRISTQHRVTQALAESDSLETAAPLILRALCENLDWQVSALWCVDPDDSVLRLEELFHVPGIELPRFMASTRGRVFERGVGLPGRVWKNGKAAWIPDVTQDDNFPRAPDAEGLHGAFAFPIMLHERVLGVIEVFTTDVREPDPDLLALMTVVGSQIGQYIERKRTEEALRESEHRFRLAATTVPSVIWTAAPDGTLTYANDVWFAYCGLTPEENALRWHELVLHPDDRDRFVAAWTEALREGHDFEIEVRNRRHDGIYRWFVTRAVPLRDASGRITQWFGSSTDIEDRKRSEQTTRFLADASAALAVLMDTESTLQRVAGLAVPHFADWCAVDALDPDGSIRRVAVAHVDPSKVQLAYQIMREYPPDPSAPRGTMHVLKTGLSEWAAAIPDEWRVAAARDENHLHLIRKLQARSYICVPLKARTQVNGALTFVMAESGRSYREEDVRAAEDLASRTVIAMENTALLATLKEADRRKDEFLAMLAHELRNPLAPIRNAVQIFRTKGPAAPELQWATEVIDRQVHQMTRLVDDLLDVSRITRGKIELRKELVELRAVVDSAVEACRPLIETWGHRLAVTVPPRPIRLHADPTRLAQVLSNLLNNAAKYTNQGGQIGLSAHLEGEEVIIVVRDTGIGIPEAMLPQIFDIFTQVERTVGRSEGGLGIGLTLVQRLVELHGGSVEARSAGLGKGSEFSVRLPIATEAQHQAGEHPAETEQAQATTRRILIVDDNRDAADSLGMLLRMVGNEVHTAHDGLEALGAAATFQPHVVLLDIGLPKLDGYEVARRIREQEGGRAIMLVAVTGWGQEDDRRRSREAGFDYHLTKPIEFKTLQRLLVESDRRE